MEGKENHIIISPSLPVCILNQDFSLERRQESWQLDNMAACVLHINLNGDGCMIVKKAKLKNSI